MSKGELQQGQARMSVDQFRAHVAGKVKDKPKAQIRLSKTNGPNKIEAEYKLLLEEEYGSFQKGKHEYRLEYERHTLRLSQGTIYTPDWTVWLNDRLLLVIEVKGPHIHRDASLEKFKCARDQFPHIKFRFAQKLKSGWSIKE